MEVLKTTDSERLKRHQTLYKTKTPPWKDAFRAKCFERLRFRRGRLVDRFRGLDLETEETIDIVMKEEWKSFANEQNDLPKIFDDDAVNCNEAEINDYLSILDEIQRELIEEGSCLRLQERRLLVEYYAETEAESINSTIDWLERDEVICPFCKKSELHQNLSIIFCRCGFRIDTQQDGFTLGNFRQQLHEGLNAHEKTCSSASNFSLLQYCSFANLAITCEACNFMYLVI